MRAYSVRALCCLSALVVVGGRVWGDWRGGCLSFAACRTSVSRDLCCRAHAVETANLGFIFEVTSVVSCVGRLARVWRRLG